MDALFLRQVWAGMSPAVELLKDATPLGKARLHYFLINKGPGPGSTATGLSSRALQQSRRAPILSVGIFERRCRDLDSESAFAGAVKATGFFTVIRSRQVRREASSLRFIQPRVSGELAITAALLRDAASLTDQPSLRKYLEKRAALF